MTVKDDYEIVGTNLIHRGQQGAQGMYEFDDRHRIQFHDYRKGPVVGNSRPRQTQSMLVFGDDGKTTTTT